MNTHGGQLGEAYLHGMNGIGEGVGQIRGASVNPVCQILDLLHVPFDQGHPTSAWSRSRFLCGNVFAELAEVRRGMLKGAECLVVAVVDSLNAAEGGE